MDSIQLIIDKFESFVKRSLLPSSSFLMLYMIFDILRNKGQLLTFLSKESHSFLLLIVLFVIFIGLSNLLTILQQFFYDNQLKENFEGNKFFDSENKELKNIRTKVMKALSIQNSNDYLLYHIIGKKLGNQKQDINTKRYIDDIKNIGIFFISFLIVFSISILHYISTIKTVTMSETFICIVLFLTIYPIYYLGKELIKSKYRSRAIRIYTNYLDEVEEN